MIRRFINKVLFFEKTYVEKRKFVSKICTAQSFKCVPYLFRARKLTPALLNFYASSVISACGRFTCIDAC